MRLVLASLAILVSTLAHGLPVIVLALVKLLLPGRAARRALDWLLAGLAESWIAGNGVLLRHLTRTRFVLDIDARLRRDGRYLVLANHQSWADIPVLHVALNRRVPLLRFFLKRELIWVPILGLAWWALDFPFMRRHTREEIARRPALANQDIETTRRACAKFREIPVSVTNFVEGTRFTPAKHAEQDSPYRRLLRPKAGGVAFVLAAMGDVLEAILDVTIAYPAGRPTIVDLFADRVPEVRITVRERPIPRELVGGDYQGDPDFRARFQDWMNALWQEKDEILCATPDDGGK